MNNLNNYNNQDENHDEQGRYNNYRYQDSPPPPRKKFSTTKALLIIGGTLFFIFSFSFFISFFNAFAAVLEGEEGGGYQEVVLVEECGTESCDPKDMDRIALIYAEGIIREQKTGGVFEYFSLPTISSADIAWQLERFSKDSSVQAIAVEIDSPGGESLPSRELYNSIKKANKEKPVYVYINSLGASGGYYAASPASKIYSNQESLVGSIGAIITRLDCSRVYEEAGIGIDRITSGQFKDMGNPSKPMTEEEREIYQRLIDDSFVRFKDSIVEERTDISSEDTEEVFSGAIFSANRSKELGLVDEISSFEDFLDDIIEAQKINTSNYQIFGLRPAKSRLEGILGLSSDEIKNVNMSSLNTSQEFQNYLKETGPQVMYLYNQYAVTDNICA
jgi:protease IV